MNPTSELRHVNVVSSSCGLCTLHSLMLRWGCHLVKTSPLMHYPCSFLTPRFPCSISFRGGEEECAPLLPASTVWETTQPGVQTLGGHDFHTLTQIFHLYLADGCFVCPGFPTSTSSLVRSYRRGSNQMCGHQNRGFQSPVSLGFSCLSSHSWADHVFCHVHSCRRKWPLTLCFQHQKLNICILLVFLRLLQDHGLWSWIVRFQSFPLFKLFKAGHLCSIGHFTVSWDNSALRSLV